MRSASIAAATRARSTTSAGVAGGGRRVDGRLDRGRLAVLDVGERVGVGDGPGQGLVRRLAGRRDVDEHEGQRRVGIVGAEDVGGDTVGNPQATGQERAVGIVDLEQPAVDERGPGLEVAGARSWLDAAIPASPSARPTLVRRRVTSSLR